MANRRFAGLVTGAFLVATTALVGITDVADAVPVPVVEIDFNDGTWGDWVQSGGPALSVVDDAGDGVLQVANRSNDFDGIKSPAMFEAGVEYVFSMDVKLATPGTAQFRFVTDPGFTWIGNTTVNGDGWTTVSGSFTPSAAVAVYIGSGNHSVDGSPYTYFVDDIVVTSESTEPPPPPVGIVLSTDFEDGLDGWAARSAQGNPTVEITTAEAHAGAQAALVSSRAGQGDGIGHDVTGLVVPGGTYEITAWVKFAAGAGSGDIWLSMQRTNDGASSFDTVGQFTGVTDGAWREVTATYVMTNADTALLYFETAYPSGTAASFLVDDIVVESLAPPEIEDITPVKDTVDFNLGVAIDSRETAGSPAELLVRHFDQVTPENHMKPEAWYDAARTFRIHPEATTIMDFADANGLDVYGHTLVWHSQTPPWFFEADDGTPLTASDADRAILRERMRDHIFSIAEALSAEYGLFGSDTNPLVAWDVVNEVVSDGTTEADGLRRSRWYDVLGEEYIDLAFAYADEAFNDVYAAAGSDRPVVLAINDYNTEQSGKRQRTHDLVARLLARGVPVDAVGHQFHLSLSTPIATLEEALVAFEDLPVTQVVSELDVTTGTPVTEALLIDQGYFYRDAFRIFRAHTDDLFSVTLWGLTDNRSWRVGAGDPLLFDAELQSKPAYHGAVDGELAPPQRSAFVFRSDTDLNTASPEWAWLPLHTIDGDTAFQLRWGADSLTAYVEAADANVDATDAVAFLLDGAVHTVRRDGTGDTPAEVVQTSTGWAAAVELPLLGATLGQLVDFDVQVTDGVVTHGWNQAGAVGTLTLVEPVSYTEAVEASSAPVVDGGIDSIWSTANTVSTDVLVEGAADGATADVRTLWDNGTLYVLAEVTDSTPDLSGSDPWVQDSLEIFLDGGNFKNGPYRFDDTQIRINSANVVSFGTGDVAFQQARLESATTSTPAGYVVEASISLLEYGGIGTFHGLDFQVNDGTGGVRTSIRAWADPTGIGYQTTARWGVVKLVEGGPACDVIVTGRRSRLVVANGTTCVMPGAEVRGVVEVRPGASLYVDGASIRGAVLVDGAAVASFVDSDVHGAVLVDGAGVVTIDGSDLRGAVAIGDVRGSLELTSNTMRGLVAILDNHTAGPIVIGGNRITGLLMCFGNTPPPTDGGTPNTVRGRPAGQCATLT
ncbi:MAG TPA: endo-1,4-beta-xylanase [Ilumatobacteraceae bacterium]|nr:endo-1,4-beta-xylanase [Ilumatobacteraceae bacterium]